MTDFLPKPVISYQTPSTPAPTPFSGRAALLVLSAIVLGITLQLTQGFYSPLGISLLALSLILCILGTLGPNWLDRPIAIPRPRARDPLGFGVFTAIVMAQLLVGIWKIQSVPKPNNDVWVFHTDSAIALEKGINPYSLSFPNIYYPDVWVYAPEVVHEDRLLFGYPYPPVTLLLVSLGHIVAGDARYAMLAAMTITGVLIVLLRPDRIGMLIAAVLLCTPIALFVLELGWTEPLQAMLLAITIVCGIYKPRWLGIPLGFLIAAKQYLPATLFLIGLITTSRRDILRTLSITLLTALVITLPLALWDIKTFTHSVITLQLHQPFRKDALSFLNLWRAGRIDWVGPSWVAFVALAVSVGLCYWRRVRFAASIALMFFMFFAFNKQAFANYYYFIIAALCIAAAGERLNRAEGSTDKP